MQFTTSPINVQLLHAKDAIFVLAHDQVKAARRYKRHTVISSHSVIEFWSATPPLIQLDKRQFATRGRQQYNILAPVRTLRTVSSSAKLSAALKRRTLGMEEGRYRLIVNVYMLGHQRHKCLSFHMLLRL